MVATIQIQFGYPETNILSRTKQVAALVNGQWAIGRNPIVPRAWMVFHVSTGRRVKGAPICCLVSARALVAELSRVNFGVGLEWTNAYFVREWMIPEDYRPAWREAGRICRTWPTTCAVCAGAL